MRNIIEVDGHKAVISFDPDIALFRGEFLGLRGGADFYASSVEALYVEGRKSLGLFLQLCESKGISPVREFSGRFNVRLTSETHEAAVIAAAAEDKSLNDWVAETIAAAASAA